MDHIAIVKPPMIRIQAAGVLASHALPQGTPVSRMEDEISDECPLNLTRNLECSVLVLHPNSITTTKRIRRPRAQNKLHAKPSERRTQTRRQEQAPRTGGEGDAGTHLVLRPPPPAGARRCLIVYAPPTVGGERSALTGIRRIAQVMRFTCREIMTPFREKNQPPSGQENMKAHITKMLMMSGLTERFRCHKFAYAIINDAIVVGFATGGANRINATLLGQFLLSIDHDQIKLNALLKINIARRYIDFACDYGQQDRLTIARSELTVIGDTFVGIIISSDMLFCHMEPALALEPPSVSWNLAHDLPLPMVAQSKPAPKAHLKRPERIQHTRFAVPPPPPPVERLSQSTEDISAPRLPPPPVCTEQLSLDWQAQGVV